MYMCVGGAAWIREQKAEACARAKTVKAQKKEKSYPEDRIFHYSDHSGYCSVLFVEAVWPSDQQADRNEYYGIESDGQLAIVVNNEILEPRGMISDGRAYVEYATVRDYINSRFY